MRRSRSESRSTSIRTRLVVLVAAAAALAGGVAYRSAGDDVVGAVPWQDVSAKLPGIEGSHAVFRVIRHADQLDELQRELEPGVAPRSVDVDYTRSELVFASEGPRSSSGYGVEVVRVEELRRTVLVTVRETSPALGDDVRAGVTYPYALIEIPRVDKHVHIRWQDR